MKYLLIVLYIISIPLSAQTAAPETFNHDVSFDGQTVTVNFTKYSVRGPLFDVVVETENDPDFVDHPHDTVVRTYLGSVDGQPGTIAAGMIRASGEILARITFADGTEWVDVDGTVTNRGTAVTSTPSSLIIPDGGAGSDLLAADILIDLPYPQMISSGGTAATALEIAEYSMVCINTSFIRDASILNRVGLVIIRMDENKDPYQGQTTTNQMLGEVRTQNQDFINNSSSPRGDHDLGLTASTQTGGGLAFVGVVGSNAGFSSNGASSNGDFSVVARHEIGHNWGSNHFEGGGTPEGKTIMSGNSLGRFSSGELAKILAHRDNRLSKLENLGNLAPPVPPRASNDVYFVEVASAPLEVSPLVNDNDSNGGAITLSTFDDSSAQGNTVIQNNEMLTIPVNQHFSPAADRVSYTIEDDSQKTSQADVFVKTFMDGEVLGHWTFEQDTSHAIDSSSFLNHATLTNEAFIENGVLHLDGDRDQATASFIKTVSSNNITYSAMVYRDGDQNSFAGITSQNTSGLTTGFNFGTSNELRYHWNDSTHWSYHSGLIIPDQTWTFVALVIRPSSATFYLNDGTNGLQTVTRSSTHILKEHANYSIGRYPGTNNRVINGMVDDVRIINRSLSTDEITALSEGGLGSCNPLPANNGLTTRESLRLKWTASPIATAQRLYISNSYPTARDATPGGAADLSTPTDEFYDLSSLTPGRYYWRVDSTETNGTIVKGNLWTFEVKDTNLLLHYPLDALEGTTTVTTACSCGSDHDIAVLGNPVVSDDAIFGNSFEINTRSETNTRLNIPATSVSSLSDAVTISLWAKLNSASFPRQNHPFEAVDADNNRIFSVHLPWTDGKVYWDAGNASNFDRISKTVPTEGLFEEWHHWTFSKNASSGQMSIYLDGELFHQDTGKTRPFDSPITTFAVGTNRSGGLRWAGKLDDLRIYTTELGPDSVRQLYRSGIPYYQWAAQHFSAFEQQDEEIVSPEIQRNLVLYSMQNNPTAPDFTLFPRAIDTGFSFSRIKGGSMVEENTYRVDDLDYVVEMSSSLTSDSWSSDSTLWEEFTPREDGTNNTERIHIRPVDQNAQRTFFRLNLKKN